MAGNKALLDKFAARVLMLSFFLPMQIQVACLFTSCAWFVFRTFQNRQQVSVTKYAAGLGLGVLYFLYLVAVQFTPAPYKEVAERICEYRMAYLFLPLIISAISPQKIRVILNELVYFIYGSLTVCLIANVWFVGKYAMAQGGFHGVNHVTYRVFFEDVTDLHPTYISMYLVLCIGILLMRGAHIHRVAKYIMFYAALAFLLPLLAKSPLIALVIMCIHVAWLRRKRLAQYKWMFAGVALMVVMSYLFVPFVSQRVNEMVGLGTSLKQNLNDNSIHERKMILAVDLSMVKQYWLEGCGPARMMPLLKMRYFFYSLYYGRDVYSFDPHNEYFFQWLSLGLVGILTFMATLMAFFVKAIRNKDNLYIYLLLILCITFLTESVLSTQHGLFYYSFFTSIFFFNKPRGTIMR